VNISLTTRWLLSLAVVALATGCAALQGTTKTGTTATAQAEPASIDTLVSFYPDSTPYEWYESYEGPEGEPVVHGTYRMWNEEGVKILEYEARHGKRHGTYRSWYPSGKPEVESQYKDGVMHGRAYWWFENGQLQRDETYVNGIKHGPIILYHENGKIKYEGTFDEGKPDGVFHRYFPNGDHEATGEYDHGKLLYENKEY